MASLGSASYGGVRLVAGRLVKVCHVMARSVFVLSQCAMAPQERWVCLVFAWLRASTHGSFRFR